MNGTTIRTFLGANSAKGFASLYPSFTENNRTIIIKGGPGSGKSSIMKRFAAKALKENFFVEYCYCSSDADSLDAIRIPEKSLCVVDGTAPHLLEPRFPGAHDEIFYTGQFWNRDTLEKSFPEIQQLTHHIKGCFARAYRYLAAAEKTADDIRATALNNAQKEKLCKFARDMSRRLIPRRNGFTLLRPRFLNSISPQGYVIARDTVYTLAERVFVLDDPYRISDVFLDELMKSAEDSGQEIYLFYDPLCPDKLQHLVFPECGIAFVTANKTFTFEAQNAYRIHLERFLDINNDIKKVCRVAEQQIDFCYQQALCSLKKEKAYHDDLEEFYIEAMDFKGLNNYVTKFMKQFF